MLHYVNAVLVYSWLLILDYFNVALFDVALLNAVLSYIALLMLQYISVPLFDVGLLDIGTFDVALLMFIIWCCTFSCCSA